MIELRRASFIPGYLGHEVEVLVIQITLISSVKCQYVDSELV